MPSAFLIAEHLLKSCSAESEPTLTLNASKPSCCLAFARSISSSKVPPAIIVRARADCRFAPPSNSMREQLLLRANRSSIAISIAEIAPSFPYKGVSINVLISCRLVIGAPTNLDLRNCAAATIPCTNSPVIVGADDASPQPDMPLLPVI